MDWLQTTFDHMKKNVFPHLKGKIITGCEPGSVNFQVDGYTVRVLADAEGNGDGWMSPEGPLAQGWHKQCRADSNTAYQNNLAALCLKGMTIIDIVQDDGGEYYGLVLQSNPGGRKAKQLLTVWIDADPEGNNFGWLELEAA